jgi:hypothetical protein
MTASGKARSMGKRDGGICRPCNNAALGLAMMVAA